MRGVGPGVGLNVRRRAAPATGICSPSVEMILKIPDSTIILSFICHLQIYLKPGLLDCCGPAVREASAAEETVIAAENILA